MRFNLIAVFWMLLASISYAHTEVFDDRIQLHNGDVIPRFTPDLVVAENETTIIGVPGEGVGEPQTHLVIEVHGELHVYDHLTTNTILIMPGGSLHLWPGNVTTFTGEIPDKNGDQWGRGIIVAGDWQAHGTEVEPWRQLWATEDDSPYEYEYEPARSITLRSDDDTRAHCVIVGDGTCDLRYVHFDGLGRTTIEHLGKGVNQIGRYPIHFHHTASQGNLLRGLLVTDFRKWGITIHGTRNQIVEDCVVVGTGPEVRNNGAGIAVEDGSEASNVIRDNFCTEIYSPYNVELENSDRAPDDNGFEGHGYWFAGTTDFTVTGNVARRCKHGFSDARGGLPDTVELADGSTVDRVDMIPREWSDNTSIKCSFGLDAYEAGTRMFPFVRQRCYECSYTAMRGQPGRWVLVEPDFYNNRAGVRDSQYSTDITVYGGRVVGCEIVAFTHGEVTLVDCLLADNNRDWQPRQSDSASYFFARLVDNRRPNILFRDPDDTSLRGSYNARRRLVFPDGTTHDILLPQQMPNAIQPFSRRAEVEPRTNAEMWELYDIWHNHTPNDGQVELFPEYQRDNDRDRRLPAKVYPSVDFTQHIPAPGIEPRVTLHLDGPDNRAYLSVPFPQPRDRVIVRINGRTVADETAKPRTLLQVEGYDVPFEHTHTFWSNVDFQKPAAGDLVESWLIRNDEVVARWSSEDQPEPDPEPDPLPGLLEELADAEAALEFLQAQQVEVLADILSWLQGDDTVDVFAAIDLWIQLDEAIETLEGEIAELKAAIEELSE